MMFDIGVTIRLPEGAAPRAVVADDDCRLRAEWVSLLEARGYEVVEAADGYEALAQIGRLNAALAILRLRMDAYDGERAAMVAHILYPRTRIILTSGVTELSAEASSIGSDAFPVLHRPINPTLLDRCLSREH
jgi:CheY-like chemotaxis protein